MKNFVEKNFDWIAKLKPIVPLNHPKVITRIRPLFECLELEDLFYSKLNKITVAGCSRCSYFIRQDKWYDILRLIDKQKPYFKIGLVRALEELEIKTEERQINECIKCGEPTDKEICGVCRLKQTIGH